MEGKLLGAFRIESVIGSGGMGTVYRARVEKPSHGLEPGTRVALKILHPHLLSRGDYLERFLREAKIGARIRHENIVDVFGAVAVVEDDDDFNFMVMEYVEGRTLRVLLEDLGTVPESLLREIARQVASGLAAIHDAGIIHRDLKPENALLTREDQIRIMDLGLAKVIEESVALTNAGDFAGSLQYAAPEQYDEKEIGPWTDLYSLGVLMHELATGDNPFHRETPAAMMLAHVRELPDTIQARNPDISSFLSQLVATLLSKDPGDRIPSAMALVTILAEGEWSEWWQSREGELLKRGWHAPKISVRREARLCGREEELDALVEAWKRTRTGAGNTVLIEGEAGLGKTRLVDAFLRKAAGPDAHVLYGTYAASDGQGGLSDAVVEHFGTARLEEALQPYLTAYPDLLPVFAARIRQESSPEGSADLSGSSLEAVVCHLLWELAAEKPVLWAVEDLHLADAQSRRIFFAMARAAVGHPVLMLATARPGLPEEELAELAPADSFHRMDLPRLGAREVIELLGAVLKSETLTDRLGAKVAFKSDGVPFFVLEIVQGLKERGLIEQHADGTYKKTGVIEAIEVPSAVRDMIEARFLDLSTEERSLLGLASVMGYEFDPDLVARARGAKRVHVLERLAALERRTGAVRSQADSFRFDHSQLREMIYKGLDADRRVLYHTQLADALAEREGVLEASQEIVPGRTALFIASHHLMGVQPGKALPFLDGALSHLGLNYRHEALLRLANRTLKVKHLLKGELREMVLLHKAGSLDALGMREEERAALEEAVRLADESGKPVRRIRTRRKLGRNLLGDFRAEEAQVWLEVAVEMADAEGERREFGLASLTLGNVYWSLGKYDESAEHHTQALRIARKTGDLHLEARARDNLGNLARLQGRFERAREHYERSATIFRKLKDQRSEGAVRGNLGNVHGDLGRYEEARPHHDRAISIARMIVDRPHHAIALLNRGSHCVALGDPDGAARALGEAQQILKETGARLYEGYVLYHQGEIAQTTGNVWEATRRYEEALDLFREIRHPSGIATMLLSLGRIEEEAGHKAKARRQFEEALEMAGDLGEPGPLVLALGHLAGLPGESPDRAEAALKEKDDRLGIVTRMHARYLLYQATEKRAYIEEAYRLLLHLRDHAPEDCREAVLKKNALHRDILRAWRDLQVST